jgi:formiminoglutamase
MKKAGALNASNEKDLIEIRQIVGEVDKRVSPVIEAIISAGKEAIIIGGGHNNAFPNIKGTVEALRKIKGDKTIQLGVINCDAHSDYRKIEGRHSGNGFRYAFNKGYLSRYSMVGLHENYNSSAILDELQKNLEFFSVSYFEDIFIRQNIKFEKAIEKGLKHLKKNICGIEIDMDAVQNIPTSAKTSSGISTIQARQYVHETASKSNSVYLHIAEAAPVLSHIKADNKTGKLIAYLISDYIKAKSERNSKR